MATKNTIAIIEPSIMRASGNSNVARRLRRSHAVAIAVLDWRWGAVRRARPLAAAREPSREPRSRAVSAAAAQRPLEQRADRSAMRDDCVSRACAHGGYAADQQFLLDNSVHDGVAGYEVLTPFRPDGRRSLGARESRLGAVPVPTGGSCRTSRSTMRRARRGRAASTGCLARACGSAAPRPSVRPAPSPWCHIRLRPKFGRGLERAVHDYQLLLDAERGRRLRPRLAGARPRARTASRLCGPVAAVAVGGSPLRSHAQPFEARACEMKRRWLVP